MDGFALLLGHLVGDYILQNDWMAKNKTGPGCLGHTACTYHCLFYTVAVALLTTTWMPWWGLLACFAVHWPIDRFRLAGWWMRNVSGQRDFATGPLSPWSIIVVDNTFHLLTLWVIAVIAGR